MTQEKERILCLQTILIFIKTSGSYASDDAAEPDVGTGCRGRCVYARRDGPELHVGSFACYADSVYPEYASFCCNRRTGDSRGTVLGQGQYQNAG